jgi:peroxiredoxin
MTAAPRPAPAALRARRGLAGLGAGWLATVALGARGRAGGAGSSGVRRAATPAAVGQPAPAFTLRDTAGRAVSLADFKGKHVVLEWVNPGCPYVQRHYEAANMQGTQKGATQRGVVWLAVNSTAADARDYLAPAALGAWMSSQQAAASATLMDPEGQVGRAYGARTTPHLYVIDPRGTLVYAGGIDDRPRARIAEMPGATNHVRKALDELLAGKPVSTPSPRPTAAASSTRRCEAGAGQAQVLRRPLAQRLHRRGGVEIRPQFLGQQRADLGAMRAAWRASRNSSRLRRASTSSTLRADLVARGKAHHGLAQQARAALRRRRPASAWRPGSARSAAASLPYRCSPGGIGQAAPGARRPAGADAR